MIMRLCNPVRHTYIVSYSVTPSDQSVWRPDQTRLVGDVTSVMVGTISERNSVKADRHPKKNSQLGG